MEHVARLLIVDDDEMNRDVLCRRLQKRGYLVEAAEGGQEALNLLQKHAFDLVLLDNMMPGLSGVDVLQRLRQRHSASELPVIMVTAQCESANVVKALGLGANDYITKPVDFEVAVARVETQLARRCMHHALREEAEHAQTTDPVTSLPNRAWLEKELRAATEGGYTLLVLEPDHFHRTQDTLPQEVSEGLLASIAGRLRGIVEALPDVPVTAVRCGESQFALLVAGNIDGPGVADRVGAAFREPFLVEGEALFVIPTIGIARCPRGEPAEGLLRGAYAALRYARKQGPGQCEVFSETMRQRDLEELRLENDLRRAVEQGDFVVYYQPKIDLDSGHIDGCEALVRWQRPGHGLVLPDRFIGIAERTGLIVPIGKHVMDRACLDMTHLRTSFPDLTVSVNVSVRQFSEPDLFDQIWGALEASGLPPTALRVEITETVLMANPEVALPVLERLRALGIGLKLDDFGAGYSSLSYLHRFPFDTLKIDRSFVSRLGAGGDTAVIVRAIIKLAQSLNMKVVAEGVETGEQATLLRELGCHYGQGYGFSRPVELKRLRQLLAGWNPWAACHLPPTLKPEEPCQNSC